MEKEREIRGRDLKKNGALCFPSPSSTPSPSGSNNNCNGKGDEYVMENCKKARAKGLHVSFSDNKECKMDGKCNGGESEGEDGFIFRSPLNPNGGGSSRRRVKLQGKVSDNCGPVAPLVVPSNAKKLRSAIHKRCRRESLKQQHASDETQQLDSSNAERLKQKMIDEIRKAEAEVADTLISMAGLITSSNPVETKEDGEIIGEKLETKGPSASPSQDPKFLVPCNGTAASNPAPCGDGSPDTVMVDPSTIEETTDVSVSKKLDAEANMEPVNNIAPLRDAVNLSNPQGASLHHIPENGTLQPTQLDAHLLQKQVGPTSMEFDPRFFKQKPECDANGSSQKAPNKQPALHRKGHKQLIMLSSNKAASYPSSVSISGRPDNINGLPMEKLSLSPADTKRQWNKCGNQVWICHLIQNHQKEEKNQLYILQNNQAKAKEGSNYSSPLSNVAQLEKSKLEARNRMSQDSLLQAQQAADFGGAYAQQKQGSELPTSSAVGDTKSSARNGKKSGQFQFPYPPNPFMFPQGAYALQYQEQLAAGANHQVQLQLQQYMASGMLPSHMGHASARGTSTNQQQQQQQQIQQQLMWQAQLAHYTKQLGFAAKNPSSSTPPSFPLPADFNPHNLHNPYFLPLPLSSAQLSSISKQQQNGAGPIPQSSS